MVPEGWQQVTGDDVTLKITKGASPKWQGFEYQDDGVLFVTSENVRDGYLDLTKEKYLPTEFGEKLANSKLECGDILINIVGASIGRSCQFALTDVDARTNQAVALFRPNQSAVSSYLRFFFQAPETIERLLTTQSSTARSNLSLGDLRGFRIDLPPLPEQRKIAEILLTWDAAIEKSEALLATAKAQKRALMQSLLTGKRRFPGFEGQPWKEVRLGDVARIYDGTHATPKYVEHGVPFYSVEHLTKDQFSNTKYIAEDVFEKENKRVKLERSDILMSRIGDVGTTRLIDWDVRASFYVSLALIKSAPEVSPEYLAQYMNSQEFQAELWKRMIHVAFPKKINLGEIGNCVVRLPSRKEQIRIAKALNDLDMEIKCGKSEVTKLRAEKKALMQQLLTGKRRVSV